MRLRHWLVKTEPTVFSYTDLERLGRDVWNGVRNFAALKHMRDMKLGDLVFIYHTGNERQVVGVAEVVREAYQDPAETDPHWIVVDVAARYRLKRPVTLAEIKADPRFAGWELVRQARLSAMPVPEPLWQAILELADHG